MAKKKIERVQTRKKKHLTASEEKAEEKREEKAAAKKGQMDWPAIQTYLDKHKMTDIYGVASDAIRRRAQKLFQKSDVPEAEKKEALKKCLRKARSEFAEVVSTSLKAFHEADKVGGRPNSTIVLFKPLRAIAWATAAQIYKRMNA